MASNMDAESIVKMTEIGKREVDERERERESLRGNGPAQEGDAMRRTIQRHAPATPSSLLAFLFLVLGSVNATAQGSGDWTVDDSNQSTVVVTQPQSPQEVTIANSSSSGGNVSVVREVWNTSTSQWEVVSGSYTTVTPGNRTQIGCATSERIKVTLMGTGDREGTWSSEGSGSGLPD